MNINKTVHLFLQKLPNLQNKKIAVGYSAGADSTALLHVMKQKREHFKFELEAVFFSHKGSPISDGEENNLKLARHICSQWNINLVEVELEMKKTAKKSWEEIGRNGRLDFYKNNNYDFVFLGHHQDDQNETTMMQIFRGGGRGVSAMKPKDGIYCRPLLKVRKSYLYEYLKNNNIPWLDDPTNSNSDFTRNFWRNIGLPTIEKHYYNYSDLLENFRAKMKDMNQISFDMARLDGLDFLVSGQQVNISQMPEYRIKNLLSHAFSFFGHYSENKKVENFLEQGFAHKVSELIVGDYVLNIKKGMMEIKPIEPIISLKHKI